MISNHCLCKYFMMTLGHFSANVHDPIEVVAFVYAASADDAITTTRAYLLGKGRPADAWRVVARELGAAGQS